VPAAAWAGAAGAEGQAGATRTAGDAAIDAAALDELEAKLDAAATAEAFAIDIVPFEAESDAAAGAARPGRLQLDLDPLPDISATLSGTMEW
jgi:hypothetical protein